MPGVRPRSSKSALIAGKFQFRLQDGVGPQNAEPLDVRVGAQSGVHAQRCHRGGPCGRAYDVLLKDAARFDFNSRTNRRTVGAGHPIARSRSFEIERDPVASLGDILQQLRRAASGDQQKIAQAVAGEIGCHTGGRTVGLERAEE